MLKPHSISRAAKGEGGCDGQEPTCQITSWPGDLKVSESNGAESQHQENTGLLTTSHNKIGAEGIRGRPGRAISNGTRGHEGDLASGVRIESWYRVHTVIKAVIEGYRYQ